MVEGPYLRLLRILIMPVGKKNCKQILLRQEREILHHRSVGSMHLLVVQKEHSKISMSKSQATHDSLGLAGIYA